MTPQQMQQALQSSRRARRLVRRPRAGTGGTGGTGANGGGGFVSGSIIAEDSNSITVKLADGSTKIVLYSGSTTINVSQTGTASDLAVGKDVTVTGTANSDGSVTATRIQMGTLGGFNGGPPGPAQTGPPLAAAALRHPRPRASKRWRIRTSAAPRSAGPTWSASNRRGSSEY